MKLKTQPIVEKNYELDFLKINNFCFVKDAVKIVKTKTRLRE